MVSLHDLWLFSNDCENPRVSDHRENRLSRMRSSWQKRKHVPFVLRKCTEKSNFQGTVRGLELRHPPLTCERMIGKGSGESRFHKTLPCSRKEGTPGYSTTHRQLADEKYGQEGPSPPETPPSATHRQLHRLERKRGGNKCHEGTRETRKGNNITENGRRNGGEGRTRTGRGFFSLQLSRDTHPVTTHTKNEEKNCPSTEGFLAFYGREVSICYTRRLGEAKTLRGRRENQVSWKTRGEDKRRTAKKKNIRRKKRKRTT